MKRLNTTQAIKVRVEATMPEKAPTTNDSKENISKIFELLPPRPLIMPISFFFNEIELEMKLMKEKLPMQLTWKKLRVN